MDCMAAKALKSSVRCDIIGVKSSTQQQAFVDDVWCVTAGLNNSVVVPSDDFSVDDLLDFADKDFKDGPPKEEDEAKYSLSSPSSSRDHYDSNSSSFSETDDFALLLSGELAVPADELENLEWLSQIVDDSQSELSLLCPVGSFKDSKKESFPSKWAQPAVQIRVPCFPLPVPVKARSKRSRPNGRGWSGSPSLTSFESSTTSSSSYDSPTLVFSNPVQDLESFSSVEKPPVKKPRKVGTGPGSSGPLTTRRCSHCQVQKTPQWRTGPLGPKTLCNACGVRYKSGRLFPEYRPACSPTFLQDVHSNSHRKVLEMRRKKEMIGLVEPGLGTTVSSF